MHKMYPDSWICLYTDISGILKCEKVQKFGNFQANLVEIRIKMVIFGLRHSVPLMPSPINQ